MLSHLPANKIIFIIGMISLMTASACSNAQYLRTEKTDDIDIKGNITVIFYGYNYSDDPETAVFFDIEGDEYTFEPYASEHNFQIAKGVDASLALKEARWFVGRHSDFRGPRLRKILHLDGTVIGYEMRPLYHITKYGRSDVIDIYYRLADAKIIITVEVKDYIKRKFRSRSDSE